PTGQRASVDISAIPLTAIDRIEILPDGASAIYGSDAVSGVVNFILKAHFNGNETLLQYGGATWGNLSERRVGQTLGRSWEDGSVIGVLEYYHKDPLLAQDRS